jgi:hypothetical protein
VAEVRYDRELHCVFVEAFGGGRPPDTPAVLLARVGRDGLGVIRRAIREQIVDPLHEPCHELGVDLSTAFRLALSASGPRLSVIQALGLGALERLFLDEQSLPLVSFACATPFQHHGDQRGVLARASRERRIARRQKHEVIEIGTGEAERSPIARQEDQRPGAEIFATFVTARLAG